MNTDQSKAILTAVLILTTLLGCGEPSAPPDLYVTGSVAGAALAEYPHDPVMVLIARKADITAIRNDPMNTLAAYVGVEPGSRSFRIDLAASGLGPGDTVFIAAFIDRSPRDRAPYPDTGDIIGFWINPLTFATEYRLSSGDNNLGQIPINREIFDFKAAVSGMVVGNESGDMTVFAYAGPLTSLNLAALDPNLIVGFARLNLTGSPAAYVLPILPYGFNVPIENVRIIALLDVNRNGGPDAGDKIGYFTLAPPFLPAPVTITAGALTGIDIRFLQVLGAP